MDGTYIPAGTLIPKVMTVRPALITKATAKTPSTLGMFSLVGHKPSPFSVNVSQGLASSNSNSATGSLVYLFQKLMSPVTSATRNTSSIGYFLMIGIRRKVRAQKRDALMKRAPNVPPNAPVKMKATSSKTFQSTRYRTSNKTILLLPYGFRNLSDRAAAMQQKKLKSTPLMGAPKATATPLAALALRISLRFASFALYFENIRQAMLPMEVAICTYGPSLPRLKPEATLRIKPRVLMIKVRTPRYPWRTKPLRMTLTSATPLPAAE
ncbi:unnamed protein product [Periconia digitata]|uniref:Uncharacterized protein n=1 Tax=Periconia digitata TaxID=1303443 RepID=A0A9W4UMK4_9PLEO|nr:unnamed protein product [Periconia digitata]